MAACPIPHTHVEIYTSPTYLDSTVSCIHVYNVSPLKLTYTTYVSQYMSSIHIIYLDTMHTLHCTALALEALKKAIVRSPL